MSRSAWAWISGSSGIAGFLGGGSEGGLGPQRAGGVVDVGQHGLVGHEHPHVTAQDQAAGHDADWALSSWLAMAAAVRGSVLIVMSGSVAGPGTHRLRPSSRTRAYARSVVAPRDARSVYSTTMRRPTVAAASPG